MKKISDLLDYPHKQLELFPNQRRVERYLVRQRAYQYIMKLKREIKRKSK